MDVFLIELTNHCVDCGQRWRAQISSIGHNSDINPVALLELVTFMGKSEFGQYVVDVWGGVVHGAYRVRIRPGSTQDWDSILSRYINSGDEFIDDNIDIRLGGFGISTAGYDEARCNDAHCNSDGVCYHVLSVVL